MNKILLQCLLLNQLKLNINKINKNNKGNTKHVKICLNNKIFNFYFFCIFFLIKKKSLNKIINLFGDEVLFGTGGKREVMGMWFNKTNQYSSEITAQSFSQYLIKKFGKVTNKKGIVLAYDFRNKKIELLNRIKKSYKKYYITSIKLTKSALRKYCENKINMQIFNSVKSTPEISFVINELKLMGGCIFTASHNNLNYGGEKLYNKYGSQIITPNESIIIKEAYNIIYRMLFFKKKKIYSDFINKNIYIKSFYNIKKINILVKKNIRILYSSMHGSGMTSVFYFFFIIGFNVYTDIKSCNLSSDFENIILKTPNPEISLYTNNLKNRANLIKTNVIITTDSDADRLGIITKHKKKWFFLNGNQISTLITNFIISNDKRFIKNLRKNYLVIKTIVSTSIINKVSFVKKIHYIKNAPVGFKNIGKILNILKRTGLHSNFIIGLEESHGFLFKSYGIDKNPATIIAWIYELATILKKKRLSLIDYLNLIYSKIGFHINQLVEFNHFGYKRKLQIKNLIKCIKKDSFFKIKKSFVYNNNNNSFKKNIFYEDEKQYEKITILTLKKMKTIEFAKMILRNSGTEPKTKIYIEITTSLSRLLLIKKNRSRIKKILDIVENKLLKYYHIAINTTVKKQG